MIKQLIPFLREELAPKPRRLEDALRITILTLVVVILTEVFQTPLIAYSAYIVFFISKEERASTFLTAIIGALSVTLAVFLALVIYAISAGEPGLRLPLMALVVFIGMFFSRTSTLGLVSFVAGFLVTIALTLIDLLPLTHPLTLTEFLSRTPTPQLLTKSVLWLWPIIMLPVGIVILGNLLTGRDPAALFYRGLIERLEVAGRLLIASSVNLNDQKKVVSYVQVGTDELLHHLKMASIFKKKPLQSTSVIVAHVGRLMTLMTEWTELKTSAPELVSAAKGCGTMLLSIAKSLKEKTKFFFLFQKLAISPSATSSENDRKAALLLATIIEIVEALPQILEEPAEEPSKYEKPLHHLLVPDAFSNPEHVHYALKTTLAIFIAYITYNMVDWPEIRTCLITCFFVALGTLGETIHKMVLRLAGAIIGGALGLASIIFIMPYLTTITGLSLLIAVIGFGAAWVATSSARLSYAGLQIALAFFLCIFVGYGPQIDLKPARDRFIGVILGNLIIFFVFSLIWPVRVSDKIKHSLSEALDKLSEMFSIDPFADKNALFFSFNTAIAHARSYADLDPLEPFNKQRETKKIDKSWIEGVQALSGCAILLAQQPCSSLKSTLAKTDQTRLLKAVSTYLSHLAKQIKDHSLDNLQPSKIDSLIHELEIAPTDSEAHLWLLACADWYRVLDQRLSELAALFQKITYHGDIQLDQDLRESSETL